MQQILHLSCSPRGHASESYRLSQKIVDRLVKDEPTSTVVSRDIGGGTLPHIDEGYAISQHSDEDVSMDGSSAVSATLVRELEAADIVVIGTPVHNFTVPSALKAWIDHVVRVRWTFDVSARGKVARLNNRPVYIAVSSGGLFSGENARQPDFLTPYLRAVFGVIGIHDLTFFSVQGTVFGPDALLEERNRADAALLINFPALR
jgi:FMN-dependent NADH-azoreductase